MFSIAPPPDARHSHTGDGHPDHTHAGYDYHHSSPGHRLHAALGALLRAHAAIHPRPHRAGASHGPSALDARLFHGSGAISYDRWTRLLLTPVYARVARDVVRYAATLPLPTDRPLRIVDLGTGPGHLAVAIARRLPPAIHANHAIQPRAEVIGFDLSPDMIARARANAARSGLPSTTLRFECADVASLPLEDASVDLAVSTFSVHHWSGLHAPIRDIARVLRPGAAAWLYDLWGARYTTRQLQDALQDTSFASAGIDSHSLRLLGIPLATRLTLRR